MGWMGRKGREGWDEKKGMRWDRKGRDGTGREGMGWDGTGWDEIGQEGMGWERKRWDGMR